MTSQNNNLEPIIPAQISNFMYDLMKAVMKDQSTMSQQQLTDAQSAQNAVKLETSLYDYWKAVLKQAAQDVKNAANNPHLNQKERALAVQAAQAQYSSDNAQAQNSESQQDGMVQATQGQAQSDATNLQMKAQIQQAANSILTTLVNMLGSIIG